MPRGQFYTVFTLGFATAIGLSGIVAAISLLFWHEPYRRIVVAMGSDWYWLSPLYFSLIVAGLALFVAYWSVRIQQALVRWSGDRLIVKLNREYKAIAQMHGRDQADEFMRLKAVAMIEGNDAKRFDLFGREKMLHSLASAGVRMSARRPE